MDTARVCFEGTLEKTSGILKNKTKVWMVLHDLTLTYYKNSKRSSCIGSIDMVTVQSVVQKKTMGGGKKIEIITATNSYHFEAETSELCEAWVSVLHKSLALKSATPGSEIATFQDRKGSTAISDGMSSSASGKQRRSSSTFYDELDSIPSSPTVFGVKLKSRRQSRKSSESMGDKPLTPSSPVSPISPRSYADKHSSKFSFSHTEKTKLEKSENEKATIKISDSGNYGLKSKSHDQNKASERDIRGGVRNRLENNDSGENEVEAVRLTENRIAEVAQVPEIAGQEQKEAKETFNEATDISLIISKQDATYDNVDSTDKVEVAGSQSMMEINKHVNVRNVRDALPTLHHENSSKANIKNVENNTDMVANNVALSVHSGEFIKDTDAVKSNSYEKTKAACDNTVDVMEEALNTSFKQNENESDTSEKTDANSNNIHMKANYTDNESGTDSQFDSEMVNDDVSHVQMRRGKTNDNESNISNQYSDVDLSQVEMRKSSRSRSRGSYNTASEQIAEARNTEVSAKLERLRSLKGSISLEDSQNENTEYSQSNKKKNGAEVEYDVNETKSSRKLDNLSSLCLNGDLDEPVFLEEVSSVKQKQSQLRLDAYTKLKSFIEQADKYYDIEQHRKCTAFAAVSLEKVLKDI